MPYFGGFACAVGSVCPISTAQVGGEVNQPQINTGPIVIRMCLGLAYPPASFEENKNDASLVNETIHPEHEPRRIVHFDFDPKNSRSHS